MPLPAATLRAQLDALVDDAAIAGVKIGMLAKRGQCLGVADFLDAHKFVHVVLDPVSRPPAGNAELLDAAGQIRARRTAEARQRDHSQYARSGISHRHGSERPARHESGRQETSGDGRSRGDRHRRASRKSRSTCSAKGAEVEVFGGDHVKSPNTHGSGCTFSSAIAAQLAHGQQLREAVILAKAYVTKAIEKSYPIGKGAGRSISFSASIRSRRLAASTKSRSTACIPPPNPPPTKCNGRVATATADNIQVLRKRGGRRSPPL